MNTNDQGSEPHEPQTTPLPHGRDDLVPPPPETDGASAASGAEPAAPAAPAAGAHPAPVAADARPPARTGPRTGPIVWGALILAFCGLDTAWWITATVIGLGVLLLVVGGAILLRGRR
jgi:hypothetical protein